MIKLTFVYVLSAAAGADLERGELREGDPRGRLARGREAAPEAAAGAAEAAAGAAGGEGGQSGGHGRLLAAVAAAPGRGYWFVEADGQGGHGGASAASSASAGGGLFGRPSSAGERARRGGPGGRRSSRALVGVEHAQHGGVFRAEELFPLCSRSQMRLLSETVGTINDVDHHRDAAGFFGRPGPHLLIPSLPPA